MTFTHQDTGYNSSASSTSLAVTLSGAVTAGDLLVVWVQSGGAGFAGTTVSDTSGNGWVDAYNGQLWYCASAKAAAGGVTVTAAVTTNAVYQLIADRFTPSGPVVFGGYVASGSAGTIGLNYNTAGCGDLGTVPAGALAWGAFSVSNGAGDQSYTPGFQTGTTSPADVIGSQFTGANGTGLSVYTANCANEDATLTWYGTGTGAIGSSGSMYFTAVAPPPAALFTHADSAIAQATANVTVITVTLTGPVSAGDLLVCAAKSPDGSMTAANLSDTAGNTWTVAGGGNYLYLAYCLASSAAPGGLTLTVTTTGVSHHGVVIDRFTPASGYAAAFGGFSENLALSSFSTGLNYLFGNQPPGTIAGVPAGALAYTGFFVLAGDAACVYSGGYQDGSSGTPAVIGSQVTQPNGDGGFSEYVPSANGQGAAAMQWYGTGASNGGWAVQGTFTAVPVPAAAPPPVLAPPVPPGRLSPAAFPFILVPPAHSPPAPVTAPAAAALSGSGTLTAAGQVSFTSAADLSGSGTVTAPRSVRFTSGAALSGSGGLSAPPLVSFAAACSLSGSGTAAAPALVTQPASAALSGTGSIAAAVSVRFTSAVALTGSGTLTAAALVTQPAAAALSGSGSAGAAALVRFTSPAALAGSGTLTAAALVAVPGAAVLSGTGLLLSAVSVTVPASAALSGLGTAGAAAPVAAPSGASLSGTGTLAAGPSVLLAAAAVLAGSGVLAVAVQVITPVTEPAVAWRAAPLPPRWGVTPSALRWRTVMAAFPPVAAVSLECVNVLWLSDLDGTSVDPTGQAAGQPRLPVYFAFPATSGNYSAPAQPVTWFAASWLLGGTGRGYVAQALVGPSGVVTLTAGQVYDVWSKVVGVPESPEKFAGTLQVF